MQPASTEPSPGPRDRPTSALRSAAAVTRDVVRLQRATRGRPLLVLSRGKVGSSAIGRAIRSTGRSSLQVHWYTATGWREAHRLRTVPAIEASAALARLQIAVRRGPRWEAITLCRDRLAQRVSWFFEIGERNGFFTAEDQVRAASTDLEPIVARFERFYWSVDRDWFDDELRAATGIDVYQRAAAVRADGWDLVDDGRWRLAVVRYEDLTATADAALGALIGESPPLPQSNVGASKPYGELYARIVRDARLPSTIVDHAYRTREMTTLYADDEREQMRARWT